MEVGSFGRFVVNIKGLCNYIIGGILFVFKVSVMKRSFDSIGM